mgnify:CR=1 FL=1
MDKFQELENEGRRIFESLLKQSRTAKNWNPTNELDVVHENYEYQSHKILKKAHYGEDVTEYIIEHKYKVDIEGNNTTHTVNKTDTIKVTLYNHIYYSKVNDGKVWKY